jgi:hypothetical protein
MLVALAVTPWADAARAAPEAVLVPVRLPITGTRDTQVTAAILRQLDVLRRAAPERGVLVLEFTGGGEGDPAASDFGRALELARFLTDARLTGVKTVAFLPQGVSGHAVLPVLACEEIVMPADAVLGPAHVPGATIDAPVRVAYGEIAARRRTVPPAVAVSLVDPATRVARVATDAGEQFVAPSEVDDLRRRGVVLDVEELQPSPLALPGRRARELGFVRLLASSVRDVPASALPTDRSRRTPRSMAAGGPRRWCSPGRSRETRWAASGRGSNGPSPRGATCSACASTVPAARRSSRSSWRPGWPASIPPTCAPSPTCRARPAVMRPSWRSRATNS